MAKILNVSKRRMLGDPFELQGFTVDQKSVKTSKKNGRTYGRIKLNMDGMQQMDLSALADVCCTTAKNTKIFVAEDDPTLHLNTPELFAEHNFVVVDGVQVVYDGENVTFE